MVYEVSHIKVSVWSHVVKTTVHLYFFILCTLPVDIYRPPTVKKNLNPRKNSFYTVFDPNLFILQDFSCTLPGQTVNSPE